MDTCGENGQKSERKKNANSKRGTFGLNFQNSEVLVAVRNCSKLFEIASNFDFAGCFGAKYL